LQEKLRIQKPIFEVGVAIRRRYFERSKQDFVDGKYVDARGTANQELIEAGHTAAHTANFKADSALFRFSFLGSNDVCAFMSLYGGPLVSIHKALASSKYAEIRDLTALY
jgi:hypothetical protein